MEMKRKIVYVDLDGEGIEYMIGVGSDDMREDKGD